MDIKWETPPTIQRRGRPSSPEDLQLAASLRDNPDQWARIADFQDPDSPKARSLAQSIRSGQRTAFRIDGPVDDGEFEAKTRRIPGTNVTAVFVRYATVNTSHNS